jgi:hypothetical protein
MSRKRSERQRAVVIHRQESELRDERDALLAELDGCTDTDCPCHWRQHQQLDTVRWLLGEATS